MYEDDDLKKYVEINLEKQPRNTTFSASYVARNLSRACAYISPLSLAIFGISTATLAGVSPASLGACGAVISLCQMIPMAGQIALAAVFGVLLLAGLKHMFDYVYHPDVPLGTRMSQIFFGNNAPIIYEEYHCKDEENNNFEGSTTYSENMN